MTKCAKYQFLTSNISFADAVKSTDAKDAYHIADKKIVPIINTLTSGQMLHLSNGGSSRAFLLSKYSDIYWALDVTGYDTFSGVIRLGYFNGSYRVMRIGNF